MGLDGHRSVHWVITFLGFPTSCDIDIYHLSLFLPQEE